MCFIGRCRSYDITSEKNVDEERQAFLLSRCTLVLNDGSSSTKGDNLSVNGIQDGEATNSSEASEWIADFNPRSKEEITRNCVSIDKEIKSKVIHTVFEYLLSNAAKQRTGLKFDGGSWRKGGSLLMGDVVGLFDKELLQELKNECGGLQTLLRNHCHIFQGEVL